MGAGTVSVEDGWLVMQGPENPVIRVDARALDRVLASDDKLVMAIEDLVVSLKRVSEPRLTAELANQLAPVLHTARSGPCVFVGDDVVGSFPQHVSLGDVGSNVPRPGGGVVQAAILLLAIRAADLGRCSGR